MYQVVRVQREIGYGDLKLQVSTLNFKDRPPNTLSFPKLIREIVLFYT